MCALLSKTKYLHFLKLDPLLFIIKSYILALNMLIYFIKG